MSREVKVEGAVRELHRGVQWTGWQLLLQRIGHDPRAFVDAWCAECRKLWPRPTVRAIEEATTDQEETR